MDGQWTPFLIPLLGSSVMLLGLALSSFKNSSSRGATPLGGYLLVSGLFNVLYALQLWMTDIDDSFFLERLRLPVGMWAAVFGLLVAFEYTNRERWLRLPRAGMLFAPPAIVAFLVFVQPDLFFVNTQMREELSVVIFAADRQIGYWLSIAYPYILGLAAMGVISLRFFRSIRIGQFRGQTVSLFIAYTAPLGSNAVQNTLGLQVSFVSLGFAATGILLYVTIFRFGLFTSAPIARRQVLEDMDDGFLVVDRAGQIIDANQQAREIFGGAEVIEQSIEAVYPAYERRATQGGPWSREYRRDIGGDQRVFDVQVSPVSGVRGGVDAHVIRFSDITERKERERELEATKRELERSNEKLDQFAGMVSHDLQNPLTVIKGRAKLLRSTAPDEHVEPIERNAERMETMIEDLLTLSRAGVRVDDPEPVPLAPVVTDSWTAVSTGDSVLDIDIPDGVELKADGDRLRHVFENLFGNAIEHNDSPVTVRVGMLSDESELGFFVADDGAGIPVSERQEVFEQGYTTSTDGTGFGLPIVKDLVEAHGWTISVGESQQGGARFEVDTTEQG
jgi:PAS domain S-box-containing protein